MYIYLHCPFQIEDHLDILDPIKPVFFNTIQVAIPEHRAGGQDAENVHLVAESLARASRHLVLSGDWMTSGPEVRTRLETGIRKSLQLGIGRKESLEAVVVMSSKPGDSPKVRIKNNTFKFCIKSLFPRR